MHLKRIKRASSVDLVNEAALLATWREAEEVTLHDFTEAIERIMAGLERRNRVFNASECRIIAVHEAGHALVAMSIHGMDKVHEVSIIPRGIDSLGYTIHRPTADRFVTTRQEFKEKHGDADGGRAAEPQGIP